MSNLPNAPRAGALLIRNAHVLTLDDADTEWPQADIVIDHAGRIAALGPDAGLDWNCTRTIDAQGLLAMPGLINAHFHSPGNLMKGCLDGLPLEVFMLHEVPPLAADPGDAAAHARQQRLSYLGTMLGALEMLRRGITSVHDDAYHLPVASNDRVDCIMQAYADVGIRATVAIDQPNIVEYDKFPFLEGILPTSERAMMDSAPRQTGPELLAIYQHLIDRWHGAEAGRLSAAVSCSAPQRVTEDYLLSLSELSKRYDLPFNIHILETKLQRVLGDECFGGRSLVRVVHDLGVLDERMMVIHAIWIDDADIALLAASGCTVAHNPICNLRLGSGVMPWRALRDAGIPLCLGSDEMNTDDTANLWAVSKTAALIHTLSDPDSKRWPQAAEVLHAATRGGARALRRSADLGFLAVGCAADLCLLDLDTHAFTPLNDLRRQLVYCEDGSSVRFTIVAGRVVYEEGKVTTVDERALRAETRALMAQEKKPGSDPDAQRLEPYYRAMLERSGERDVGMRRTLAP